MASNSPFNFGQPASTGGTASPFGGATSGSGGGLFGGGSGAASSNLFGGNKPAASPFGASTGTAPSGGTAFGQTSNQTAGAPSAFSFGTQNQAPSGGASGLFGGAQGGGGLFGQKKDDSKASGPSTQTPASSGQTSLFGSGATAAPKSGGFSFAGAAQTPAPPSTTPAAPKFSFGGQNSTTPAAPPPASNPGLFGTGGGSTGATSGPGAASMPFGSTTPAAPAPSAGSGPNLFGNAFGQQSATPAKTTPGGLFGKPAESTSATQSTTPAPASSAAPAASQPAQSGGMFSFNKPAEANKPAASLFGAQTNTPGTTLSSAEPTPAPAGSGTSLFSTQPATSGTAPSGGLFKLGSQANIPLGGGLFGALGGQSSAPAASSAAATTANTTATTSSTPAATSSGGLFGTLGGVGAMATTSASTAGGLFGATSGPAASSAPSAAPLSQTQSQAQSQPQAQAQPQADARSRLKNKSMDEILTRWAADLSKYQKEFQKSAKQVAAWDTMLVKNTEKISKLYAKTFQAERDASEVEKQVAAVESEQEELDQWLTKYEAEVDDMIKKVGGGLDGNAGGVDMERERVYRVAERVTERLEGLNRDLGDVIDEVNGVSALVGKSSGPDDQLSNIVRVLNSHLQQLQEIDSGARKLQERVEIAKTERQRLGSSANGWHGIKSDAAEDFYKSYLGRR